MIEYLIQDTTLTAIGNSIRAKTGGTTLLAPSEMPTAIDNIPTGGGGEVESGVIFIDYDGTIVESWESDAVASKTALPNNPSHDRLVAQGWNWTLADIKDYIVDYPEAVVVVGQMYKTASRLTEFDITLNKVTGKDVTCNMVGNKDWGDGSKNTSTSHTYEDYGDYTITCDGVTIPSGSSSSGGVFATVVSNARSYMCKVAYIGELVTRIADYSFANCNSLSAIAVPNTITQIRSGAFSKCYSLTSIVVPTSWDSSQGSTAFADCFSLGIISMSNNSNNKYFPNNSCNYVKYITIPRNVETIGINAFYNCNRLTRIEFPESITTISAGAFSACYAVVKYDFTKSTIIPVLENRSSLSSINGQCKIIVPDALYDDWIVATNWSTYADYIYKASEVTD